MYVCMYALARHVVTSTRGLGGGANFTAPLVPHPCWRAVFFFSIFISEDLSLSRLVVTGIQHGLTVYAGLRLYSGGYILSLVLFTGVSLCISDVFLAAVYLFAISTLPLPWSVAIPRMALREAGHPFWPLPWLACWFLCPMIARNGRGSASVDTHVIWWLVVVGRHRDRIVGLFF